MNKVSFDAAPVASAPGAGPSAMVYRAHELIAEFCADIAALFKSGARVSVVVRNPALDRTEKHSAAMFISDDDPDLVIEALNYLKGRDERTLATGADATGAVST
ncbi:MAG: hypothetical protein KGL39_51640 [Patescibacteria group bacterium]|nr:hypothetical protein [Patescibacteria group bacterium]